MKTIETVNDQTLLDVALQHYGTAEATGEIILGNPELRNDPAAVVAAGREPGPFYPDIRLAAGTQVRIDDDSRLVIKTVVKKINRNVTTYTTEQWQERLNR